MLKKFLTVFLLILIISNALAQIANEPDSLIQRLEQVEGEEKIKLCFEIAQHYFEQHSDSLFFVYILKAHELSLDLELTSEICSSDYYLGLGLSRMGLYDSARYHYDQAMNFAEENNDLKMISLLQTGKGISYLNQGNLEVAKSLFDQSIENARIIKDSTQILAIMGHQALCYSYKGEYEMSAKINFEALEIAERMGLTIKQSILLTNICVLYGRMKEYELAMKYQRASINIDLQNEDVLGLAYGYNNMGNIYRRLGNRDSAIYYYEKSLEANIRLNKVAELSGIMSNIAVYYLEGKNFDKAHEYLSKALAIADSLFLINEKAFILMNIGNTYEEQGFYTLAEDYYLQTLKISRKHQFQTITRDIIKHLAKISQKQGKYRKAYQYLQQHIGIKDSLITESNQRIITEMRTKYETEKIEQENEILIQTAQIQELELKRQQTQFWLLLGGIIILLLIAILAFVYYRMRQRNIRTRLEKQSLENEQRMLRSQMNPHFIFNSMNSIQSYISGNDSFTAMTYLSKFAQLMRGILENSRNTMIPLEEEIKTLNLYVELESLRFKNKFKYNLNVDPQLPSESTYIPPMLIQPFVENAIKHGLKKKNGDGLLSIVFRKEGEMISCTVSDNGMGREDANKNKASDHRSMGMQVTRERLEALKKEKNTRSDFIIHDLKDETGKAIGTVVNIVFPYEEE